MPLPNLLTVGCQKAGTTWLHAALAKSSVIFGSEKKEIGFFLRKNLGNLGAYEQHFPAQPGVRYYMESTPHYFRLPADRIDVAARMKRVVPDATLLVVFRDPVDRYESAYIHHIFRRRLPYRKHINEVTDEFSMISFGRYASILEHWKQTFPDIHCLFYDDLVRDPSGFVDGVFEQLGIERDIPSSELDFRLNDRSLRIANLGKRPLPVLGRPAREQLCELYRDDVERLADSTGRDLSAWLVAEPAAVD